MKTVECQGWNCPFCEMLGKPKVVYPIYDVLSGEVFYWETFKGSAVDQILNISQRAIEFAKRKDKQICFHYDGQGKISFKGFKDM